MILLAEEPVREANCRRPSVRGIRLPAFVLLAASGLLAAIPTAARAERNGPAEVNYSERREPCANRNPLRNAPPQNRPASGVMLSCMDHESFFREWTAVDAAEQRGRISEHEARRLKYATFRQMLEIGLTPDDVVSPGG